MPQEESSKIPRTIGRRRVLTGAVAAAAAAGGGAFALNRILGESGKEDIVGPPMPAVEPGEQDPGIKRYDMLASLINDSAIAPEQKARFITNVEKYRDIEAVQARFMGAYQAEIGPDGEPAILSKMRQIWPTIGDFRPEEQIFFLRNEDYLQGTLRVDVDAFTKNFDASGLDDFFDKHDRQMKFVKQDGSIYVGLDVPLDSYRFFVHPEQLKAPKQEFSGVNAQQMATFKQLEAQFGPIFGNMRIVQGAGGEYVANDLPMNGEPCARMNVNLDNPNNRVHEYAHATNMAQNREMILHLTPEDATGAYTKYLTAIADSRQGIIFGGLGFLDREASDFDQAANVDSLNVVLANSGGVGSKKLFPAAEVHGLDEAEFWKVVDLPSDKWDKVANWQTFIERNGRRLDKLAQTSAYYRWVVDEIRLNPGKWDKYVQWLQTEGSPAAAANRHDGAYFNVIREYFDGVFVINLFNGDPKVTALFEQMKPDARATFLVGALRLWEHAIYENWAYKVQYSQVGAIEGKPTNNLYLDYYDFARGKYLAVR